MNQHSVTLDEVKQVIKSLPGQQAWRSRARGGTGSIFTLQFGPALYNDEKQGEFSLMVYCAWRIIEMSTIICTCHRESDSVLAPALKILEGVLVTNATLSEWGDLTIYFDGGRALQIWNDAPFSDSDSWSIGYQGNGYYYIGSDQRFLYEQTSK